MKQPNGEGGIDGRNYRKRYDVVIDAARGW